MRAQEIKTVTVIGAGHIGFGWAHVFCRAGLATRLCDVSDDALRHGYDELVKGLDLFVEHGLLDETERQKALDRVQTSTDLTEALAGADYVQESVPEKLDLKRALIEQVDRLTPSTTIIASSASQIPMTDIAIRAAHAERCVVAHPCNPPHIVPLVEIVAGEKTDPWVVRRTRAFMERIGQAPITLNREICGFALNRLQFALVREAFFLAREGVASIADIDRCLCEGVGLRWPFIGPFMTEELNSKDIVDGLSKDIDENEELWAALGDFRRYDETDIRRAAEGVRQIMGTVTHDEALTWRDSMVLRLRALKDDERLLYREPAE